MNILSVRKLALAAISALALSGCVYSDDYWDGYGGLSAGIGSGSYYDPYYGRSYDPYYDRFGGYYGFDRRYPRYGWYDGFYYPGTGYYVFDRYGRRHQMRDRDRYYWHRWRGDRRDWNRDRRDDRDERWARDRERRWRDRGDDRDQFDRRQWRRDRDQWFGRRDGDRRQWRDRLRTDRNDGIEERARNPDRQSWRSERRIEQPRQPQQSFRARSRDTGGERLERRGGGEWKRRQRLDDR